MREQTVRDLEKEKIIAIFKYVYGQELMDATQALVDGGIRFVEVTIDHKLQDTSVTMTALRQLKEKFGQQIYVGAGTVFTPGQVEEAKAVGCDFIVSPNVEESVIRRTIELDMLSAPGALSCTECVNAVKYGADFVKLFPGGTLGIKYAQDLMVPLNYVRFLNVAGITEDRFRESLDAGYVGAGIRGQLTALELIEAKNYAEITRRASRFVSIAREYA